MADKSIRESLEAALKQRKPDDVAAETATESSGVDGLAESRLKDIIEAALMAAGKPLSIDHILKLFLDDERPERADVRKALDALSLDYAQRPVELLETGAGFRINVRSEYATWVSRLWEERPPRYSRALLETLSLIAYRQPITRGEIEDVRGVSVSSNIIKTLTERGWVKEVGHRDVPGKPALLATTKEFLNYFGLKGLGDLPTLSEIKDLDSINGELDFDDPDIHQDGKPDDNPQTEVAPEEQSDSDLVTLEISENEPKEMDSEDTEDQSEPESQDDDERE